MPTSVGKASALRVFTKKSPPFVCALLRQIGALQVVFFLKSLAFPSHAAFGLPIAGHIPGFAGC